MDLQNIFMLLFYWLFLSGTVFVAGAFSARIFVTGPSGADICVHPGAKSCFGELAARTIFVAALITFVVNAAHLILHVSVVTEAPLKEVFQAVPAFLLKTKYGRLTILRTVLLAGIIFMSFLNLKGNNRWMVIAGTVFSFSLLAVFSMSGHQGARGYTNVPFFMDMFHIISVSLWIGGLFFMRICFSFFLKETAVEFFENFKSLINRFSSMATLCVFVAGITGAGIALFNLESLEELVDTEYGGVLLVKAVLAGIIFLLGGVNKIFLIPPLNAIEKEKWPEVAALKKRLFFVVSAEAYLGCLVLLLTSVLTHLSPEG
ncbi:MAG: CopD family protein [Nitrospirota bacterium]